MPHLPHQLADIADAGRRRAEIRDLAFSLLTAGWRDPPAQRPAGHTDPDCA